MQNKSLVLCLFFLWELVGCSVVIDDAANSLGFERIVEKEKVNNVHFYVSQLAEQLLLTSADIKMDKSIAIGTILPSEEIGGKKVPSINPMGHQIQESFVTLLTQAGLKVIEFKMSTAIKIQDNRDFMLTRKVSELNATVKADYYLTGTYVEQENDLAINVRLIDVASQEVLAAATDFIPNNAMWQPHRSALKNNLIVRGVE